MKYKIFFIFYISWCFCAMIQMQIFFTIEPSALKLFLILFQFTFLCWGTIQLKNDFESDYDDRMMEIEWEKYRNSKLTLNKE